MADKKKILVVDDHFEMLDFLRSMLELSNPDYEVVGVPSGEEGLLELHQTPFNLLITDVRLPGISGFELIRKARRLREALAVIMITGYASAQGRKEAEALGVYRYYQKPLDTDALLAAVSAALYEQERGVAQGDAPQPGARKGDTVPFARAKTVEATQTTDSAVYAETRRRLEALLSDTGAIQALLADAQGDILHAVGESRQPVARLARLLARSVRDSFELAAVLGGNAPTTIHYQSGEATDVYAANVGRDHFLILLFDAAARRGRIGTVWVFAQRAVKELLDVLRGGAAAVTPVQAPESEHPEKAAAGEAPPGGRPSAHAPASAVQQEDAKAAVSEDAGGKHLTEADTDEAAVTGGVAQAQEGEDELFDLLAQEGDEELDLDSFWEEAAADVEHKGRGMSFEEAMRQGLLPPDLNP